MVFHVEIESGMRQARAFNLKAPALRDGVIAPWIAGRPVVLAEQEWLPAASELTIVEAPRLEPHDLAHGQGWNNARRTGRDVTAAALRTVRESLARRGVAVLAAEAQDEAYVRAACERIGAVVLPWADVRAALLVGDRGQGVVAVAVGDIEPSAAWWFDAGLAFGALGAATLVVQAGARALPPQLAARSVVRVDAGDEAFAAAIAAARAACP